MKRPKATCAHCGRIIWKANFRLGNAVPERWFHGSTGQQDCHWFFEKVKHRTIACPIRDTIEPPTLAQP